LTPPEAAHSPVVQTRPDAAQASVVWTPPGTAQASVVQKRSETSKANDKGIEEKRSEAKRSESFKNDVFFDIKAKRTRSMVWKFISKRSKHFYIKELKNLSEANRFDSLKIYFEAKRTLLY
jgi:hypothetical protein